MEKKGVRVLWFLWWRQSCGLGGERGPTLETWSDPGQEAEAREEAEAHPGCLLCGPSFHRPSRSSLVSCSSFSKGQPASVMPTCGRTGRS